MTGRKSERGRGRSKKRGRESKSEERVESAEGGGVEEKKEEEKEGEEEQQEVAAVEERVEERVEELEERKDSEREQSREDVFLPVPSPCSKLPAPSRDWEAESQDNWDVAAEYREMRKEAEEVEVEVERSQGQSRDEEELAEWEEGSTADAEGVKRPLPGVDVTTEPFSFLASAPSLELLQDQEESESGGSQSDVSSVFSGFSLAIPQAVGRRADLLPGPWLRPSQQRLAEANAGGAGGGGGGGVG